MKKSVDRESSRGYFGKSRMEEPFFWLAGYTGRHWEILWKLPARAVHPQAVYFACILPKAAEVGSRSG